MVLKEGREVIVGGDGGLKYEDPFTGLNKSSSESTVSRRGCPRSCGHENTRREAASWHSLSP